MFVFKTSGAKNCSACQMEITESSDACLRFEAKRDTEAV